MSIRYSIFTTKAIIILFLLLLSTSCYKTYYETYAFDKSLDIDKKKLALLTTSKARRSNYDTGVAILSVDGNVNYKCGGYEADCDLYLLPGMHTLSVRRHKAEKEIISTTQTSTTYIGRDRTTYATLSYNFEAGRKYHLDRFSLEITKTPTKLEWEKKERVHLMKLISSQGCSIKNIEDIKFYHKDGKVEIYSVLCDGEPRHYGCDFKSATVRSFPCTRVYR